jgi:hypothetical protein
MNDRWKQPARFFDPDLGIHSRIRTFQRYLRPRRFFQTVSSTKVQALLSRTTYRQRMDTLLAPHVYLRAVSFRLLRAPAITTLQVLSPCSSVARVPCAPRLQAVGR